MLHYNVTRGDPHLWLYFSADGPVLAGAPIIPIECIDPATVWHPSMKTFLLIHGLRESDHTLQLSQEYFFLYGVLGRHCHYVDCNRKVQFLAEGISLRNRHCLG